MPSAENPTPRKHCVFAVMSIIFTVIFLQSLYSFYTSLKCLRTGKCFRHFHLPCTSVGKRNSTVKISTVKISTVNWSKLVLLVILFSSREVLRRLYQSTIIQIKIVQSMGYSHLPRNGGTHNSCILVGAITSRQSEIQKIRKQWTLNSRGLDYLTK